MDSKPMTFTVPENLTSDKSGKAITNLVRSVSVKNVQTYRINDAHLIERLKQSNQAVIVDAQKLKGFFLPVIIAKAKLLGKKQMLLVKQSFEPLPLYAVLGKMGYVFFSEVTGNNTFHIYFIRKEIVKNFK